MNKPFEVCLPSVLPLRHGENKGKGRWQTGIDSFGYLTVIKGSPYNHRGQNI